MGELPGHGVLVLVVAGCRQMCLVVHVCWSDVMGQICSRVVTVHVAFSSLLGPTCLQGRLICRLRGSAAVQWARCHCCISLASGLDVLFESIQTQPYVLHLIISEQKQQQHLWVALTISQLNCRGSQQQPPPPLTLQPFRPRPCFIPPHQALAWGSAE